MPNGEVNVNLKFPRSEYLPSSLPVQTGIQRGKARPFDNLRDQAQGTAGSGTGLRLRLTDRGDSYFSAPMP